MLCLEHSSFVDGATAVDHKEEYEYSSIGNFFSCKVLNSSCVDVLFVEVFEFIV